MILTHDDIDWSRYLVTPDLQARVVSASTFRDDVIRLFHSPDEQQGLLLPWQKLEEEFRVREHELSVWMGFNGHWKSLALGQAAVGFAAQGHKVLVISLEMRAERTLQRMCRQTCRNALPSIDQIAEFHEWADDKLWLFDYVGELDMAHCVALVRWGHKELGITQFVIDSMMRVVRHEDDMNGQKDFVSALACVKQELPIHIHLVHHARKLQDEFNPPGKMDAKGSGAITDLIDNLLVIWRNKRKERERQKPYGTRNEDLMSSPDGMLAIEKQRNGENEPRIALWMHNDSMQVTDYEHGSAMDLRRTKTQWRKAA